mmetsp:Transcript_36444/g.55939  ORF Transcript_36444/g.55939 Transcript_36444/m.55939 type:complete len:116 (+) Transcript_36444:1085-1432(+)
MIIQRTEPKKFLQFYRFRTVGGVESDTFTFSATVCGKEQPRLLQQSTYGLRRIYNKDNPERSLQTVKKEEIEEWFSVEFQGFDTSTDCSISRFFLATDQTYAQEWPPPDIAVDSD